MKSTSSSFKPIVFLLLVATLAACSTFHREPVRTDEFAAPGKEIQEIMPGLLQGYLPSEEQLDSKAFVLPAPAEDSALQALDTAWSRRMLELRGTARWDLAISDADLSFPSAAAVFACTLGIPIGEKDSPELYMLMRRTLTDLGLASYSAKNAYQRARPFMVNEEPVCTPQDAEALRKDGSYPSGHTAIGWGWALILTELSPDRAEAILARGRSFGESRNVCNAHWYSDVVAGRVVGAAAVARLQSNEEFRSALDLAGADIARVRRAGLAPKVDCEAEAKALAMPLY